MILKEIDSYDSVSQMDSTVKSRSKLRGLKALSTYIWKVIELASNIIEDYILFNSLLPNAKQIEIIVNNA